jgi:hypothetical protein
MGFTSQYVYMSKRRLARLVAARVIQAISFP